MLDNLSIVTQIIIYSSFAGITVPVGAYLAKLFNHHTKEGKKKSMIVHTSVAFGGGIILSAVALVLIPKGLDELDLFPLIGAFVFGVVLFAVIDHKLKKSGSKLAMLMAMLMDFIPESLALGALFAEETNTAILLSVFIGLQNLPEAFNSFRDIVTSGFKEKTALIIFSLLSIFGIVGALFGHHFLRGFPGVTAFVMVFASGGILYLLFNDIIPEGNIENSSIPAFGASLGFVVGLVGEKLI